MRVFAFGERGEVAGGWPAARAPRSGGPTGDSPSIRCSEQDVICYRRENPLTRDANMLPVRARSPAANRYSRCFGIIRHSVAALDATIGASRSDLIGWQA